MSKGFLLELWIWKGSLTPIEQAPKFMYFLWPTIESGFEAKYEKQSMLEDFIYLFIY